MRNDKSGGWPILSRFLRRGGESMLSAATSFHRPRTITTPCDPGPGDPQIQKQIIAKAVAVPAV